MKPNAFAERVILDNKPHICLFAKRAIQNDEEIRYDYGNKDNLWRRSSVYQPGLLSREALMVDKNKDNESVSVEYNLSCVSHGDQVTNANGCVEATGVHNEKDNERVLAYDNEEPAEVLDGRIADRDVRDEAETLGRLLTMKDTKECTGVSMKTVSIKVRDENGEMKQKGNRLGYEGNHKDMMSLKMPHHRRLLTDPRLFQTASQCDQVDHAEGYLDATGVQDEEDGELVLVYENEEEAELSDEPGTDCGDLNNWETTGRLKTLKQSTGLIIKPVAIEVPNEHGETNKEGTRPGYESNRCVEDMSFKIPNDKRSLIDQQLFQTEPSGDRVDHAEGYLDATGVGVQDGDDGEIVLVYKNEEETEFSDEPGTDYGDLNKGETPGRVTTLKYTNESTGMIIKPVAIEVPDRHGIQDEEDDELVLVYKNEEEAELSDEPGTDYGDWNEGKTLGRVTTMKYTKESAGRIIKPVAIEVPDRHGVQDEEDDKLVLVYKSEEEAELSDEPGTDYGDWNKGETLGRVTTMKYTKESTGMIIKPVAIEVPDRHGVQDEEDDERVLVYKNEEEAELSDESGTGCGDLKKGETPGRVTTLKYTRGSTGMIIKPVAIEAPDGYGVTKKEGTRPGPESNSCGENMSLKIPNDTRSLTDKKLFQTAPPDDQVDHAEGYLDATGVQDHEDDELVLLYKKEEEAELPDEPGTDYGNLNIGVTPGQVTTLQYVNESTGVMIKSVELEVSDRHGEAKKEGTRPGYESNSCGENISLKMPIDTRSVTDQKLLQTAPPDNQADHAEGYRDPPGVEEDEEDGEIVLVYKNEEEAKLSDEPGTDCGDLNEGETPGRVTTLKYTNESTVLIIKSVAIEVPNGHGETNKDGTRLGYESDSCGENMSLKIPNDTRSLTDKKLFQTAPPDDQVDHAEGYLDVTGVQDEEDGEIVLVYQNEEQAELSDEPGTNYGDRNKGETPGRVTTLKYTKESTVIKPVAIEVLDGRGEKNKEGTRPGDESNSCGEHMSLKIPKDTRSLIDQKLFQTAQPDGRVDHAEGYLDAAGVQDKDDGEIVLVYKNEEEAKLSDEHGTDCGDLKKGETLRRVTTLKYTNGSTGMIIKPVAIEAPDGHGATKKEGARCGSESNSCGENMSLKIPNDTRSLTDKKLFQTAPPDDQVDHAEGNLDTTGVQDEKDGELVLVYENEEEVELSVEPGTDYGDLNKGETLERVTTLQYAKESTGMVTKHVAIEVLDGHGETKKEGTRLVSENDSCAEDMSLKIPCDTRPLTDQKLFQTTSPDDQVDHAEGYLDAAGVQDKDDGEIVLVYKNEEQAELSDEHGTDCGDLKKGEAPGRVTPLKYTKGSTEMIIKPVAIEAPDGYGVTKKEGTRPGPEGNSCGENMSLKIPNDKRSLTDKKLFQTVPPDDQVDHAEGYLDATGVQDHEDDELVLLYKNEEEAELSGEPGTDYGDLNIGGTPGRVAKLQYVNESTGVIIKSVALEVPDRHGETKKEGTRPGYESNSCGENISLKMPIDTRSVTDQKLLQTAPPDSQVDHADGYRDPTGVEEDEEDGEIVLVYKNEEEAKLSDEPGTDCGDLKEGETPGRVTTLKYTNESTVLIIKPVAIEVPNGHGETNKEGTRPGYESNSSGENTSLKIPNNTRSLTDKKLFQTAPPDDQVGHAEGYLDVTGVQDEEDGEIVLVYKNEEQAELSHEPGTDYGDLNKGETLGRVTTLKYTKESTGMIIKPVAIEVPDRHGETKKERIRPGSESLSCGEDMPLKIPCDTRPLTDQKLFQSAPPDDQVDHAGYLDATGVMDEKNSEIVLVYTNKEEAVLSGDSETGYGDFNIGGTPGRVTTLQTTKVDHAQGYLDATGVQDDEDGELVLLYRSEEEAELSDEPGTGCGDLNKGEIPERVTALKYTKESTGVIIKPAAIEVPDGYGETENDGNRPGSESNSCAKDMSLKIPIDTRSLTDQKLFHTAPPDDQVDHAEGYLHATGVQDEEDGELVLVYKNEQEAELSDEPGTDYGDLNKEKTPGRVTTLKFTEESTGLIIKPVAIEVPDEHGEHGSGSNSCGENMSLKIPNDTRSLSDQKLFQKAPPDDQVDHAAGFLDATRVQDEEDGGLLLVYKNEKETELSD